MVFDLTAKHKASLKRSDKSQLYRRGPLVHHWLYGSVMRRRVRATCETFHGVQTFWLRNEGIHHITCGPAAPLSLCCEHRVDRSLVGWGADDFVQNIYSTTTTNIQCIR